MSARTHPKIAAIVGALALIALGASTDAGAGGQVSDPADHGAVGALLDRRSPDTIDATARALATPGSEPRSPDTRDAALTATHAPATLVGDLRSPDTRDTALAAPTSQALRVDPTSTSRFDWIDAGIGATSGFGIALLVAGALLLIRRSNDRRLAV